VSFELGIIVAMAKGRVIGLDGGMPWHHSEDLKHFKRTTAGHPIIMGRKMRSMTTYAATSFSQSCPLGGFARRHVTLERPRA